ncbi:pali-domain-containing protein [Flagelloscypha sp. PMI_526]|nr:pali-domain-containing protein [Flagelloscypha sp. PMI_526]
MWHFITPVLVLGAFILSLLVSISLPIVKSIKLFHLSLQGEVGISVFKANATGQVDFGAWGYCLSDFAASASVGGKSDAVNSSDYCTQAKLGYTFDSRFDAALDSLPGVDLKSQDLENDVSAATKAAAVLHIIATVLIFIALLIALGKVFRRSTSHRGLNICSVVVDLLAALLASVVFLIDVIAVSVLRGKLNDHGVHTSYGNGVWMMLGAAIVMWLAAVGSCATCCAGRRRFNESTPKY